MLSDPLPPLARPGWLLNAFAGHEAELAGIRGGARNGLLTLRYLLWKWMEKDLSVGPTTSSRGVAMQGSFSELPRWSSPGPLSLLWQHPPCLALSLAFQHG